MAISSLEKSILYWDADRECAVGLCWGLCVCIAQFYLSPQHRVVLGNRRFGANGVISNGRQHAVPRRPAPTSA
eukprot:146084-Pyramimonas_sp.AAC.1